MSSLRAQQDKAKEELRKLRAAESNVKKARENAMKEMEGTVRAAQKASSALKAEVMKLRNASDAAQAEVKNLTVELQTLKEQLSIAEGASSRLTDESEILTNRVRTTHMHFMTTTHSFVLLAVGTGQV